MGLASLRLIPSGISLKHYRVSKEKNDNESDRPLLTFAIFAYNQEQFIREAIEGAFSQTYSPLEIILSDDCSSDSTYEVMREMSESYGGTHKVVLNCNKKNFGIGEHVNKVMSISKGEIVVLATGDDISMPNRVTRSWELLSNNRAASCVSFKTIVFGHGSDKKSPSKLKKYELSSYQIDALIKDCDFHINGAARSVHRSVFDQFGPLSADTPTEDSTTLLRCLLTGAVLESNEPQVFYRVHGGNYYASSNKHSINYEKIHEQYLVDIQKAFRKGQITDDVYCDLTNALNMKLKKRQLRSVFFNSENKLKYFLFSMLFSGAFRLKEKFRFAKISLKAFGS